MMRALELQRLAKRHISGQSNFEQEIKPIALAVIELRLFEGISQSDSQSCSQKKNLLNKKILKFHSNLMQMFRVDMKTFLGSAIPNQCCYVVTKLMLKVGFSGKKLKP